MKIVLVILTLLENFWTGLRKDEKGIQFEEINKITSSNHIYNTDFFDSLFLALYIDRLTVSLYHNCSVWLDTQDATCWDRNLPNFTWDLVPYHSAF